MLGIETGNQMSLVGQEEHVLSLNVGGCQERLPTDSTPYGGLGQLGE